MLRILDARTSPIRLLGLAAVATLMLSAGTAQRAEAMTPINPTPLPAAKAASDDMITQVRHGGGGGHGGGFHGGGGFRGGGFHGGGGHIGGFRGGGFPVGRSKSPGYGHLKLPHLMIAVSAAEQQ
ncbi:putative membrane protein [Bradyrhizobium barranii subsp. barranii]